MLREDMNRRFVELKTGIYLRFDQVEKRLDLVDRRMSLIETDQKQFFRTTGIMDGRIDELSARIK